MGIVALSAQNKAIAQLNTPTAGEATFDTSSFTSGVGTIALTETFDVVPITQTGSPFASLQGRGDATTTLDVTWV